MGALVTLELPDDSPMLDRPWVITFGPLRDVDEWEPVVCGPYERPHALALAEAVVADEQLMAVVEPLITAVSVDEIRGEIAAAQTIAEDEAAERDDAEIYGDYFDLAPGENMAPEGDVSVVPGMPEGDGSVVPGTLERAPVVPPGEGAIRAGFARIAARLTGQAPASGLF